MDLENNYKNGAKGIMNDSLIEFIYVGFKIAQELI